MRIAHRPAGPAIAAAFALLVGMLAAVAPSAPASAAPITDFRPGNIISDGVMYDYRSMSLAQVTTFIATEGAACQATTGNICLKDYRETTPSRPASELCPRPYAGASSETAAAIVTKAAVACGINPQVLLVTLQKEQGLITAPTGKPPSTYARALGFGCPDHTGGWCNPEYAGFANQVYSAAQQLQRYAAYPSSFSHRAYATNYVRYHPNPDCGSSPVYIENQATASMYNYTPYQPNAAALAAGSGTGDACSSYGNRNFHIYFKRWFGLPTDNRLPIGHVDSVTASGSGSIDVRGWAFDRDTSDPIKVHVYVDGRLATALTASLPRSDIARIYGRELAGFRGTVPAAPGSHQVCVYAINQPAGGNPRLACADVTVTNTPPRGSIDKVTSSGGMVTVKGWALDPDTTASIRVHAYLDGRGVRSGVADLSRPDVGRVFGLGDAHGYSLTFPASDGVHQVCVYAIDATAPPHTRIGCRELTVTNAAPVGRLDKVDPSTPSSTLVGGWAFDPDTDQPISVRYRVDGTTVLTGTASSYRPDVGRVYGVSDHHGYNGRVALRYGDHEVCVDASDSATGQFHTVGCRTTTVPDTVTAGALTSAEPGTASVTVSGWAWDYDVPDRPIVVSVLVDGAVAGTATADRTLSPTPAGAGRATVGYTAAVPATPGAHEVCVRATDPVSRATVTLGCQGVTVANSLPFGSLDVVEGRDDSIRVRGWAMDPDRPEPINVHLYVDGALRTGITANGYRPDVERVHGNGAMHGFDVVLDGIPAGSRTVCVYAINWPAGSNPRIGCATVDVT
ncbi:hypothetical protein [Isoptericola variabilis]|uniref:Hemagglutinin-related protein n=1 Tax=Isoptericola variabilis (strain 225) TaxID=743718 RepID=F6FS17_ISOV2|nr:hypothetical protein [Isoptericola variabilis]AEG45114.1 hypothetical protein Isova_2401 [Isoptericola variabilis 225]TWH32244.1 hypothetical protein L600_001900000230 [Isoptericola variabilis J7]